MGAAARPLLRAAARATAGTSTPATLAQRRFAGGHGPAITHTVTESFGPSFWVLLAAIPTFTISYRLMQPGPDGEDPALTRWLARVKPSGESFRKPVLDIVERKGAKAEERLFLFNAQQDPMYQPRDPDMWDRYSRRNRQASSYVNMDAAKEVYRHKYFAEQDRREAYAARQNESQN
jgi:hypothetical protein